MEILCSIALSLLAANNQPPLFKPIPINIAEAIIEPFWDMDLSGLEKWDIQPGTKHGLQIKQNWAAVDFEWASKPESGAALNMSRNFNVDCTGYDKLIAKLTLPEKSIFRILVTTEKGELVFVSEPAVGGMAEYSLDLQAAKQINTITLEIIPGDDRNDSGWLRWIGLQNSEMLKRYFELWNYSDKTWDSYIKDDSYSIEYKPAYGIFLTDDELEILRSKHRESMQAHGESEYAQLANESLNYRPEQGIHEFVGSGGRFKGHGRQRDQYQPGLPGNTRLATAGLVLRDADVLRMAARYALSLAMSRHWDTGFMSHFPGSSWEDRAFRRSYTSQDIAQILDVAGNIFTDAGRIYLMRRLAEEGIGPTNFVMWRHEYVFHCNQFAYFNTGRMYAYLVLEREWPRVRPYTDIAYHEAISNLETVIQPDGGCLEGPSYFGPTIRENYHAIRHYAHARGKKISDIIPDVLKSTANFAAVVSSTTADDVIAVCDAGTDFRRDTLEVLVDLMPESHWIKMYNKKRLLNGERPIPQQEPLVPVFISLPHTGYMTSTRELEGQKLKVFIMGHKAGADHTHEDKGSFVLEFAGQTFAMDLGICDYDNPISAIYKHCQQHNMLAPIETNERAHPMRPLPVDVKPVGHGNENSFHASIDATPGWEGYYKKWIRTWDSPSPDTLIIRDEYELASGEGVEFYWQTKLPVELSGNNITIIGEKGSVTLTAPENCAILADTLTLYDGDQHNRIAIRKEEFEGILEVQVKLIP